VIADQRFPDRKPLTKTPESSGIVVILEPDGILARHRSEMFDPDAGMPRQNRALIYLGACVIAGLRLAREKQVNVRVVPTGQAIDESIEVARLCGVENYVAWQRQGPHRCGSAMPPTQHK
jgi:hypothetical protein